MRERLMASATDVARADIAAGKELYKPTGDIVWSDAKQTGYIRIKGLPKNDPGKEQYQLWIYDENQDPKTPIDGGVFDASSDGEIVIPIDAKIKVKNPKVFAITVEKPGGVVVSKQEKVAALAKVET
jgi:anti-sigma-K factor RskA